MVNKDSVFAEMERLSKEIAYHAELFFKKNKPEISDFAYDELVKRFDQLREEHPELAELFDIQNKPVPIHEPGGGGLKLVTFTNPMLSLKKALTKAELEAFNNKFPDDEFFDEYKIDGLALEIIYQKKEDGYHHLHQITTRGDGLEGEDVTHTLPLFRSIPVKLRIKQKSDDPIAVRGEGFLDTFGFEAYNEIALKKKATPRNAASGFVRALEKNMDKNAIGLLDFCIYWSDTNFGHDDYKELRFEWSRLGFYLVDEAYKNQIENDIQPRHIPTDGVVRKIKNMNRWVELGSNNRHPNYAIAYKFPDDQRETNPLSIDWQVGKTGRVTPCINYTPVRIGGVMCDRASLDNIYQFLALELREDSVISVSRNGDVIPRLRSIVSSGTGPVFKAPTECPSCGSVLEVCKGKLSAELVCNNVSNCPAQLLMRCVALVGKRCLDIDDLGPVKLGQLIDAGVIMNTSDILYLGVGQVSAKVLDRIQKAKRQPWHVIIKALGLPNIELTRAKKLSDALPLGIRAGTQPVTDVIGFLADTKNVMAIDGFSTGLALPIAAILSDEEFHENARDLLKTLIVDDVVVSEIPSIKGVITGTLGRGREELVEYFAEHGIEIADNLTKDCQFLLLGEKPSNSKKLKATELDIVIVTGTKASSIDNLISTIKELVK